MKGILHYKIFVLQSLSFPLFKRVEPMFIVTPCMIMGNINKPCGTHLICKTLTGTGIDCSNYGCPDGFSCFESGGFSLELMVSPEPFFVLFSAREYLSCLQF